MFRLPALSQKAATKVEKLRKSRAKQSRWQKKFGFTQTLLEIDESQTRFNRELENCLAVEMEKSAAEALTEYEDAYRKFGEEIYEQEQRDLEQLYREEFHYRNSLSKNEIESWYFDN